MIGLIGTIKMKKTLTIEKGIANQAKTNEKSVNIKNDDLLYNNFRFHCLICFVIISFIILPDLD